MRLTSFPFALFVLSLTTFGQWASVRAAEVNANEPEGQVQKKPKDAQPVQSFNARAKVISITDDGALCNVSMLDNTHKSRGRFEVEQPILICGVPDTLVDGDSWKGDIYFAGIYKYVAVGGALKTVRAFATTEEVALQRMMLWERQRESHEQNPSRINPPFGLTWGESDAKIKGLLAGAKAKIVDTRNENGEAIWEVEGLIQTGLKKTLFVFRKNGLMAVDLYYQSPNWDSAKYDEFLGQVQKRIETKFGPGTLVPSYKDDIIHKDSILWGFNWKKETTAIAELELWSSNLTGNQEAVEVRYEDSGS